MASVLALVLAGSVAFVPGDLGRMKEKPPFRGMLAKSRGVNILSAARFFLFGARDVWFVVGLPIFLYGTLNWTFEGVGGFLALWTIGY
ncbi:MFS transporter, partial [Tritonibacter sp. SIMBA_163]